jgi:hypothetical protein
MGGDVLARNRFFILRAFRGFSDCAGVQYRTTVAYERATKRTSKPRQVSKSRRGAPRAGLVEVSCFSELKMCILFNNTRPDQRALKCAGIESLKCDSARTPNISRRHSPWRAPRRKSRLLVRLPGSVPIEIIHQLTSFSTHLPCTSQGVHGQSVSTNSGSVQRRVRRTLCGDGPRCIVPTRSRPLATVGAAAVCVLWHFGRCRLIKAET